MIISKSPPRWLSEAISDKMDISIRTNEIKKKEVNVIITELSLLAFILP